MNCRLHGTLREETLRVNHGAASGFPEVNRKMSRAADLAMILRFCSRDGFAAQRTLLHQCEEYRHQNQDVNR